MSKFEAMDLDHNGFIDGEEARKGLKQMKTADGQEFSDKEIDFFIKTASVKSEEGDNTQIDLAEFADLLARLKMYKRRK